MALTLALALGFTACGPKPAPDLVSIAITSEPTTTAYVLGQPLDLTGLVVTGNYSDGSTKTEEVTAANVTGFDSDTAGTKTLTVTVKGKAAQFTVTVADADLQSLMVSSGTLSPAFDPGTTAYTVSVANSVTSITVTGTKNHTGATVSANNGTAQPLNVGQNPITITVTAENGAAKDYTVTVTRANLLLTVSTGQTVTVNPSVTTIYKTGTPNSLTITASGYTGYQWKVDGVSKGNAASITINAADYPLGVHRATVIASDGSGYYSEEVTFTVAQAE
jgi:hypothetical protein